MRFARRIGSVHMSGIRRMFAAASTDAINLGLGEPDFEPPESAREALKYAVDEGHNGYGPTGGIPSLRQAIAEYSWRYSKDVTSDNVIVTPSATSGLMSVMQTMVEEGDKVLIPDPGFVLYESHTRLAGGIPVPYPLREENAFLPDADDLIELIDDDTKAMVVNSPANPTGGVLDEATYRAIADIAEDKDILVISDEVNDNFIYEGKHHSFLGKLERSVVVQSFSKSLAMTGWRIGYLVADEALVPNISKMQYYMTACPATPIQYAVVAALPHVDEFTKGMIGVFDRRRRLIVDRLNGIDGLRCPMPKGAFYAFPSFNFDMTSEQMASTLVAAGVICSPGSAFGAMGEGHIRFSYAASEQNIERGMDIVERTLSNL